MNRNYGIELLRIVSMIMIVSLHMLGHGGILAATEPLTTKYEFYWIIEITCYCAVNCYVLISGYVGVDAEYKLSNLLVLWLRVLFYSVIITVIMTIIKPDIVGPEQIGPSFAPILTQQYWYFTAYAGLFLFIPALNAMIEKLSHNTMRIIILIMVVFFSVVPCFMGKDIFLTNNGYSMLWFLVLYPIGSYVKKNANPNSKRFLWGIPAFIICVAITWASKYYVESLKAQGIPAPFGAHMLISYCSPTVLGAAVALLVVFSRLKVNKLKRVTGFLAPLSFSVYLIHDNSLIRNIYIKNQVAQIIGLSSLKQVGVFILLVLGIYLGCSIIDIPRELLFKRTGLKKKLAAFEKKHLGVNPK